MKKIFYVRYLYRQFQHDILDIYLYAFRISHPHKACRSCDHMIETPESAIEGLACIMRKSALVVSAPTPFRAVDRIGSMERPAPFPLLAVALVVLERLAHHRMPASDHHHHRHLRFHSEVVKSTVSSPDDSSSDGMCSGPAIICGPCDSRASSTMLRYRSPGVTFAKIDGDCILDGV